MPDDKTEKISERTLAEMRRGTEIVAKIANDRAQLVARHYLSAEFNPDHAEPLDNDLLPNGRISPEQRRQRDEYRKRMGSQLK